jgi:hypothetical protein
MNYFEIYMEIVLVNLYKNVCFILYGSHLATCLVYLQKHVSHSQGRVKRNYLNEHMWAKGKTDPVFN